MTNFDFLTQDKRFETFSRATPPELAIKTLNKNLYDKGFSILTNPVC